MLIESTDVATFKSYITKILVKSVASVASVLISAMGSANLFLFNSQVLRVVSSEYEDLATTSSFCAPASFLRPWSLSGVAQWRFRPSNCFPGSIRRLPFPQSDERGLAAGQW